MKTPFLLVIVFLATLGFSKLGNSQELFVQLDVPIGESTVNASDITTEQICFHDDASFPIVPSNTDFSTPVSSFDVTLNSAGTYGFTVLPCSGANFSYAIVHLVASGTAPPNPEPEPPTPPTPEPTEERRIHYMGHSLIFQEERNVPHWMNELAILGGRSFAANGQYGFFPTPPATDDLGWPGVPVAWTDDFSVITDVVMTVYNFGVHIAPDQPNEVGIVPITEMIEAIDWVKLQNPNIRVWVYESWADAGYITQNDSMTPEELEQYHAYNLANNAQWYDQLMAGINEAHSDVTFMPVARIISGANLDLLNLQASDLYVDSSPHGTANTYFLAALVTYMSMYDDFVERIPAGTLHPTITNNYPDLVYYIKDNLQ